MKFLDPSIGTVLTAVWRHRLIVLGSLVLVLLLTVAYYLMATPIYVASTTLLVGQNSGTEVSTEVFMPTELMNAQIRIAESDSVVRAAIQRVGEETFPFSPPGGGIRGLGGRLRQMLSEQKVGDPERISPLDVISAQLRQMMSVRTEPNSNVLTIGFRHPDPLIAANFTNALAESFIERQNNLLERPGALDFFRVQATRFDDEVARRSAAFEAFVKKENTYSIEEQRTLLLRRASDIRAALSGTRSTLAEKEGQKAALSRQLTLLEPVSRSAFVLGFVDRLSANEDGSNLASQSADAPLKVGNTPPLLMIKVFQDAMAAFRMVDSEIIGLRDLAKQQEKEVGIVDAELARLSAKQTEYEKLKRDLALATFNAETYAKRTVEEQIESNLRDAKLSNVRIIQPAIMPMRAASPNGMTYLAFGVAFGLVIGVALSLLKEMIDINRSSTGMKFAGRGERPVSSAPLLY